jgi:hypothetical protein
MVRVFQLQSQNFLETWKNQPFLDEELLVYGFHNSS